MQDRCNHISSPLDDTRTIQSQINHTSSDLTMLPCFGDSSKLIDGCWAHHCELGCGGQGIQLSFHRYLLRNLISCLFVMETFGLSAKDERTSELSVVLWEYFKFG